jgi:multidrug efflux system membrane fusion protein
MRPEEGPPVVRVVEPTLREVTEYVYFTGRTEAVEAVEVRARVTGYLVAVEFKPGARVEVKQRLFQVDPRPFQAELDRANSQIALAQAQLDLAKADYLRAVEVAKTPGAIARQDLETLAAKQAQAEAELKAAQASSEVAALNLEFTDVVSPIDGIVGRDLLTVGNLVRQDSTLLTTVVSEDPMYGYFDIDERTMLRIQQMMREGKFKGVSQGGKVPIEMGLANDGETYPHTGELDFVNNRVDPSTGTLQVRGVFQNPPLGEGQLRLLKPGLFMHLRLPVGPPRQAMLIPQAAIGTDQGTKFVLVVTADNKVESRPITTGMVEPGGWQVVEPVPIVRDGENLRQAKAGETGEKSLQPGERVIVSGLQRVRPGMVVDPKTFDMPEAPKAL